jgi:hypothetical protein
MESQGNAEKNAAGFQLIGSDDFGSGFKSCTKCGSAKPLVEFAVDGKAAGGRKARCRACKSVYDKARNKPVDDDLIFRAMKAAAYDLLKERF